VKHLTIYRERLTNHATSQFISLRAKVTQELTSACRKNLTLPILWAAVEIGRASDDETLSASKVIDAAEITSAKDSIRLLDLRPYSRRLQSRTFIPRASSPADRMISKRYDAD
jgi:hypothetical protein